MVNSSFLRGPALCLLQFSPWRKLHAFLGGKGFVYVYMCLDIFFPCISSPICLVWEWEVLLPREWLAFGRTPAPLEKRTENSGKICAASWGEGKKGAGKTGEILRLPVSLQLNEHGVNMPPSQDRKRTKKLTAVLVSS